MAFDQEIPRELITYGVDRILLANRLHSGTSHPRNGRYLECLKGAKFSMGKQHYAYKCCFRHISPSQSDVHRIPSLLKVARP